MLHVGARAEVGRGHEATTVRCGVMDSANTCIALVFALVARLLWRLAIDTTVSFVQGSLRGVLSRWTGFPLVCRFVILVG